MASLLTTLAPNFRPNSASKFRPTQIKRVHEMINLIDDPHCHFATSVYVFANIKWLLTCSKILAYSCQTSPRDDPLVRIIENAVALAFQAMTLERAILLKIFPFCELSYLSRENS
ncbi:hypothetical protein BDR06DRAFT_528928 [Suillus hirtellus]|nr:hypothetical protein BDR06DRAFT_528928 [Suillus hirtellus]